MNVVTTAVANTAPGGAIRTALMDETQRIRKRESVLFNPRVFDYQIDLLECAEGERLLRGRVRAKIMDVRIGYRITVEGFGPATPARPRNDGEAPPAHKVFFDNWGEPIPTREEAGRIYQQLMKTALSWLAGLVDVEDLESLPSLK